MTHNLKTTLAGLLPAIAVVAYAAGGYFLGHIDGPVAFGLIATALGIGGVGIAAKDAPPGGGAEGGGRD
jgi:hypothetical protein